MENQILKGQSKSYQFIQLIGKGGISYVYKAKDQFNQMYAVKSISNVSVSDSKQNLYFEKEIQTLKYLHEKVEKHQHILQVEDIIYDKTSNTNNTVYLVTELCDQGDLYEFQQKFYPQFDLETKLAFSIQIAQGLQHLHNQKIVHRDLKPENCLVKSLLNSQVSSFHEKFQIKIGDFGVSQINYQLGFLKSQIGTPNYMAPEIINQEMYSQQVDIWSLGCIIYEIFTNQQLFSGGNLVQIVKAAIQHNNSFEYIQGNIQESKNINQLIKQCLAQNPSQRLSINQVVNFLIEIYERVKSKKSKSYKCPKAIQDENERNSSVIIQDSLLENQKYQLVKNPEYNQNGETSVFEEDDVYIIDYNEKENNILNSQLKDFLEQNNFKLQNVDYQKQIKMDFSNTINQAQRNQDQNIQLILNLLENSITPRGQKNKIEKDKKMKQYQDLQKNCQEILNKKMIISEGKTLLLANKQYALKYVQSQGLQNQTYNQVVFTNKNNQYELSKKEANFAYSFNFLIAEIIFYDKNQEIRFQDQYLNSFEKLIHELNHENTEELLELVKEINRTENTSLEKLLKLFQICENHVDLLQNIDVRSFISSQQNSSQNFSLKVFIEQNENSQNIFTQFHKNLITSSKSGPNIIKQDQPLLLQIQNILNKQPQKTLDEEQKKLIKQLQTFYSVETPSSF